MVYYIQVVEIEKIQFDELLKQISEPMKTEYLSLADRLTRDGIEIGLQKGLQKGREEGIEIGELNGENKKTRVATENMLHRGFEVSVICDVLEVTPEYVESIRVSVPGPDDEKPV